MTRTILPVLAFLPLAGAARAADVGASVQNQERQALPRQDEHGDGQDRGHDRDHDRGSGRD